MILPREIAKSIPKGQLLSETQWRSLGVQQSRGWVHYAVHRYVMRNESVGDARQRTRVCVCEARGRVLGSRVERLSHYVVVVGRGVRAGGEGAARPFPLILSDETCVRSHARLRFRCDRESPPTGSDTQIPN